MPTDNDLMENLLNNPAVKRIISDDDFLENRKQAAIEKCTVFLKPFTVLKEDPGCTFRINP